MAFEIETVVEDDNRCGEGPAWDPSRGRLVWTDIESSKVYQLVDATGDRELLSSGRMVFGIALHESGGLVVAGADGIHVWHDPDRVCSVVSEFEGQALAINDILADPKGRVYAGTVYWGSSGMEQHGKLYLIDVDGAVRVVDDRIELSNGIGLSPDDRVLYHADTAARRIYAHDVDPNDGGLSNKRCFVQVPDDEGIPDGLTVDAEGYVWNAQWYGGRVVRYDPEGNVERRIEMPVQQVSSVAFGGPDLTDLYVTTAGEYWPSPLAPPDFDPDGPMGGSLYRVRLDIAGRPEHMARLIS